MVGLYILQKCIILLKIEKIEMFFTSIPLVSEVASDEKISLL